MLMINASSRVQQVLLACLAKMVKTENAENLVLKVFPAKMVVHVRPVPRDQKVKLVWMVKMELRALMADLVFQADLAKEANRVPLASMDHLAHRVSKDLPVAQESVVTKEKKAKLKHLNSRAKKVHPVFLVSRVTPVRMDVQVTMA